MIRLPALVARFVHDRSGATAIEYGLIAAVIATVLIAAMGTLGDALNVSFDSVADEVGAS